MHRGDHEPPTPTQRQTALATQLLERHGIVTREVVASEGIQGDFSGLYPVFKAMEEAGRARRGYFIADQGAAQFAAPGAEDRLREPTRRPATSNDASAVVLASTDPANPYALRYGGPRWPTAKHAQNGRRSPASFLRKASCWDTLAAPDTAC